MFFSQFGLLMTVSFSFVHTIYEYYQSVDWLYYMWSVVFQAIAIRWTGNYLWNWILHRSHASHPENNSNPPRIRLSFLLLKTIGFRFFLFFNYTYYFLIVFLTSVLIIACPRFPYLCLLVNPPYRHVLGTFSPGACIFDSLSFFSPIGDCLRLSASWHGFVAWFKPNSIRDDAAMEAEPLPFSTDSSSVSSASRGIGTQYHLSTLWLSAHILLLNFSWLAYGWKGDDSREIFCLNG